MNRLFLILVALLSFCTDFSFGQHNSINELYCSLNYITENDPIVIHYWYIFPSQPCTKDEVLISTVNDTCIQLDVNYNVGEYDSPCGGKDSISLGTLSSNTYSIIFNLTSNENLSSDSDTIFIQVHEIIDSYEIPKISSISIYPNPAKVEVNTTGLICGLNISLCNIQGQEIKSYKTNGNDCKIDVSNLFDGIYIILVYDQHKLVFKDKIIVKK